MEYRVSLPFWYRLGFVAGMWLACLCSAFLITNEALLTKIVGVLGIVIFVPLTIVGMGYLFGGSYLRVDRNGIALQIFPPQMTLVAWDDILYVAMQEEGKYIFIYVRMKNYAEYVRRFRGLKRLFVWPENKYIKFSYHMRVGIPRRFCDQDALQLALKSYGHGKQWPSEPFPL